jgi:hypothetical protein
MPGRDSEALTRDRRVDPRLKAAGWRVVPFRDEYERAVREGFLVDYNVVNFRSDVRLPGLFLQEGEKVEMVDPESGAPPRDPFTRSRHAPSCDFSGTGSATWRSYSEKRPDVPMWREPDRETRGFIVHNSRRASARLGRIVARLIYMDIHSSVR